jgi:hypothetical protein
MTGPEAQKGFWFERTVLDWTTGESSTTQASFYDRNLTIHHEDGEIDIQAIGQDDFSVDDFLFALSEVDLLQISLFQTVNFQCDPITKVSLPIWLDLGPESQSDIEQLEVEHDSDPANDLYKPFSSVHYGKVLARFNGDPHRQIVINGLNVIACEDAIEEKVFFIVLNEEDELAEQLEARWELKVDGSTLIQCFLYEGDINDIWVFEYTSESEAARFFGIIEGQYLQDSTATWIEVIDRVIRKQTTSDFQSALGIVDYEFSVHSQILPKSRSAKRIRDISFEGQTTTVEEILNLPDINLDYLKWRTSANFSLFCDLLRRSSCIRVYRSEMKIVLLQPETPIELVFSRFNEDLNRFEHLLVGESDSSTIEIWKMPDIWISTEALVKYWSRKFYKLELDLGIRISDFEKASLQAGIDLIASLK